MHQLATILLLAQTTQGITILVVPIKTYTALVSQVSQLTAVDSTLSNPHKPNGPVSVTCFFQRLSAGEAYQNFGVVLKDPALIQCELVDAAHFSPEAEVAVGGRTYVVRGNPEIHDAGNDADHADIWLEFKNYALPS
ncbi:MAG: hypothetical protein ACREBW_06435 [Candidatus Micrarchaeaceae archaeon]